MKEEANGWDFIDRLYCVSLREREDRRKSALEEFSKVGLAGRVEFVFGEHHPSDMEQGVYESHMICLRHGLEAGASNIVVFEDDSAQIFIYAAHLLVILLVLFAAFH